MPAPDSTAKEVRASVLMYLRAYEEGRLTLGDLAAEMSALAPAYEHAMGGIGDSYGELLGAARRYASADGTQELEEAITVFRRVEAAW
ncbi:MAG: hypothetical protein ACRD3A_02845 [Terriglobales bacterium]